MMVEENYYVDKLKVRIFNDAKQMGISAADAIRDDILDLLSEKDEISVMFAAAPSQDTTLDALKTLEDIPWGRVNAFHMDEYVGISEQAPQSFRNYLKRHFFDNFNFKSLNLLDADREDYLEAAKEYDSKLRTLGIDLIVLGIGENGHIAFNDPPFSKFDDSDWVKVIKLTETSRIQQVHDGCFEKLEQVPEYALTVTIPAFLSATKLHCVVPGKLKAPAVKKTLEGEISEDCPASVLRTRVGATLYIEKDSASLLK
ncbi:MAG: glucosamine-6-phosphate deaminase [Sphaerochaetaceae bacterium]|nr:glucosamine-6-phosphate deaminase [Sphaerochaetaceae bacterium]